MDITQFETKINVLLTKRGILPSKHLAQTRFAEDFLAYAWFYHTKHNDGIEMLDLLDDDSKLYPSINLDSNFAHRLEDLVSQDLRNNKTFSNLLKVLTSNKGKGVGVGELVLPLIVEGWVFSNESDGTCGGMKREVKNGKGASLKPVATGLTEKGLIDKLNKKYFKGTKPATGKSHKTHAKVVKALPDPVGTYRQYLSELLPGNDVGKLAKTLVENIDDVDSWNEIYGRTVAKWYKEVDGWGSLVLVCPETLMVVNIADIDKATGVRYRAVMARGKDTQAVPDGYVNISIVKQPKSKKRK